MSDNNPHPAWKQNTATRKVGCCSDCGAPYERIIEKPGTGDWHKDPTNKHAVGAVNGTAKWAKESPQSSGARMIGNVAAARGRKHERLDGESNGDPVNGIAMMPTHDMPFPAPVTTGWRPTCSHPLFPQKPPVPCVILDPFSGSSTTAVVAAKLGRNSIMIDASAEYMTMAIFRLGRLATEAATPPGSDPRGIDIIRAVLPHGLQTGTFSSAEDLAAELRGALHESDFRAKREDDDGQS